MLGVFGRTGSGKSSIANLVSRLQETTKGNILFNNIDIKKVNLFSLRSTIGYIPQDGYLFSGSIKDNISFGTKETNNYEVLEAARKAEIIDEIENFSNKMDTVIGERGVKLSGGQKQRLGIARAFYKNPSLFIFDDCLSAVDAIKEKRILENLKTETAGKTSIIISHRITTIKEADHIIVLDKGKIIEQGTHNSLLKIKGVYSQINKDQNQSI